MLVIFFPVFLVCLFFSMFVAGAYVTPFVLEISNCAPRSSAQEAIEFSLLIISFVVGYLLFLISVKSISVSFIKKDQLHKWRKEITSSNNSMSGFSGIINKHILWAINPER